MFAAPAEGGENWRGPYVDGAIDGLTDPWGNQKAAFSATTTIDREDWNLNWNVALETGGVLVSKKIGIEIEIQAGPASG